jgi:hypothetical protein
MRLISEAHICAYSSIVASYVNVTVQGHGKVASRPAKEKTWSGLEAIQNFSYWP